MSNRIYRGRLDPHSKLVLIVDRFDPDAANELNGKPALIVPEGHDLYEYLVEYIKRRKWFEDEFCGGRGSDRKGE